MLISIGVFMVTLKWVQDFHLVFKPTAVCVNTNFPNIPISKECVNVDFIIRCVSVFVFIFFRNHILIATLYIMESSVFFFNMNL